MMSWYICLSPWISSVKIVLCVHPKPDIIPHSLFLCAIALTCPKLPKKNTQKNTWMSHTVALGETHTVVYFDSYPLMQPCCPKIFTRAPSVDWSAAENSPKQIHCLDLCEQCLLNIARLFQKVIWTLLQKIKVLICNLLWRQGNSVNSEISIFPMSE